MREEGWRDISYDDHGVFVDRGNQKHSMRKQRERGKNIEPKFENDDKE